MTARAKSGATHDIVKVALGTLLNLAVAAENKVPMFKTPGLTASSAALGSGLESAASAPSKSYPLSYRGAHCGATALRAARSPRRLRRRAE